MEVALTCGLTAMVSRAFIEANPLAGLHPEHSDLPMIATKTGMAYQQLIEAIVNSAAQRVLHRNGL
jgi:D-alanine-D-alanine ligase-like ATP-grasp enzyme